MQEAASLMLASLLVSAGTSAAEQFSTNHDQRVGTYACVAHHVVGLQYDKTGNRHAGNIALRPEEKNFLITIRRPNRSSCISVSEEDLTSGVLDPFVIFWDCARYELVFSEGKQKPFGGGLRGSNPYEFVAFAESSNFWIRFDLRYTYQYNTHIDRGKYDFYLEEGVCQQMKASE